MGLQVLADKMPNELGLSIGMGFGDGSKHVRVVANNGFRKGLLKLCRGVRHEVLHYCLTDQRARWLFAKLLGVVLPTSIGRKRTACETKLCQSSQDSASRGVGEKLSAWSYFPQLV